MDAENLKDKILDNISDDEENYYDGDEDLQPDVESVGLKALIFYISKGVADEYEEAQFDD